MACLEWKPAHLTRILFEAADIAYAHFRTQQWNVKADHSLVTAADTEIERLLATKFDDPGGGSYLLGEETVDKRDETYLRAARRSTTWIVDPIDGTAPFANGLTSWGLSIGLARRGRIVDGAIYMPVRGELFITDGPEVLADTNVRHSAGPGSVTLRPLPMCNDGELREGGMIAVSQVLTKTRGITCRNPVQASGCAVQALTYLLLGRYQGIVSHMKLWDLAGGLPMLYRHGFEGCLVNGTIIDDRLTNDIYVLEPEDTFPRWSLRGGCVFTRRSQTQTLLEWLT